MAFQKMVARGVELQADPECAWPSRTWCLDVLGCLGHRVPLIMAAFGDVF